MTNYQNDGLVLAWLLSMPLLARRELAAVAAMPDSSAYLAAERLRRAGLVASVQVSVPGMKASQRYYPTAWGVQAMADSRGVTTDALLRRCPVSAHWLRLLLSRLDSLAVLYCLAAAMSEHVAIRRFIWYRKAPLDAGVEFEDGNVMGLVREGPMAPASHLVARLGSLALGPHPPTLLVVAPDMTRVIEWLRRLDRSPFTGFLATQEAVLRGDPDSAPWFPSFDPHPMTLGQVLRLARRGSLPVEPPPRRRRPLAVDPGDEMDRLAREPGRLPDTHHLLPLALDATQKRLLETIGLWPWLTGSDLAGITGTSEPKVVNGLRHPQRLGLVERRRVGRRLRLVLTDRGLTLFARRDRVSARGVLRRWSAARFDPGKGDDWRNIRGTRARDLLRHLNHTAAVYRFFGQLGRDVRSQGGELVDAQPPHMAQRRYSVGGRVSHVKPDGYGRVHLRDRTFRFFLEWEQRAAHPAQFQAKLRAYLSYYHAGRPLDGHGTAPALLFVLRDEVVESHFLAAARRDSRADGLPILTTFADLVVSAGPLARVWRSDLATERRMA